MRRLKLLVPVLVIIFSACSKNSSHPPSVWPGAGTFLSHASEMEEQPENAPFHWMWATDHPAGGDLKKNFDSIAVVPVDLAPLGDRVNATDAQQIGMLFHDKMVTSLKASPPLGLQIVETAGPRSIVVESAILELRPTMAALNAVTSVAGFFIPGAALASTAISTGVGHAAGYAAKGSCAIGLRLKDGSTNTAFLEVADRRDDDSALLFDMKSFSQYAHSRQSIDRWARNLPWLLNRDAPVLQANSLTLVEIW